MSELPSPAVLSELLDKFAPLGPAPLCPELLVYHARSLVQVWEAAEAIAGENLPAPFWAYPWAAGCALARVVLDHSEYVAGARVLDVGAGGGIASMAAVRAGARDVVANDIDPWAGAVLQRAAVQQGMTIISLVADLTENIVAVDGFGVVLCSEMAYEKRMVPRYAALLQRARNRGARVFLADAGRTYFDARGLKQIAEYTLTVPRDLEGVDVRVAKVFEML